MFTRTPLVVFHPEEMLIHPGVDVHVANNTPREMVPAGSEQKPAFSGNWSSPPVSSEKFRARFSNFWENGEDILYRTRFYWSQ